MPYLSLFEFTSPSRASLTFHHSEHSIPTLLIPLKSPGSFLIVCENAVTVYSKAHLGHVEQTACMEHSKSTVEYDRPRVSGESRRYPTLVAWGRPRRNNSFLDDWLYLAREDGLILYLQLTYGSDTPRITSRGSIGRLECDLSRAFAVVDLGQSELVSRVHGPDVVIAVGNVGSGGCWEVCQCPGSCCIDCAHEPRRLVIFQTIRMISTRIVKLT